MHIKTLLSDINASIGKPSMEMQIVDLKDGFGKGMPVDFLSLVSPIGNRITDGGIER